MAQADGVVSNASGAAVRQDINNQIEAAFTNQSGDTSPATTYPCQFYADTANDILKIRDKNTSSTYYSLRTLDGKTILPDGTDSSPALFFSSNTDVGLRYDSTYGSLAFIRDGVKHCVFGRTLPPGQDNAFLFGPCANQAAPGVVPTNGDNSNKTTVKGVSIQDDGPVHIGTQDGERPLTLNKMGSYGSQDASAGKFVNFNTNGTFRGGIQWNGSNVAIVQSSDYRLKENVVDLTGAIDRIKLARPIRFNYIADERNQAQDGFLAHEIGEIVPEMLYGLGKDAVDSNGEIEEQSINPQGLVPLLTAALKEAITKIEALETRVAALEAG